MRSWLFVTLFACACGDNTVPIAPPLSHADTLFLVGHPDDEMIFSGPELAAALRTGPTTTVYTTTAGPKGVDHHLIEAATIAYGAILGSSAGSGCGPRRASATRAR